MGTLAQVDPAGFIDTFAKLPVDGRGAWTRRGIGFDYRYAINGAGQPRIGTTAEKSLDHWAVASGCAAIQRRLHFLGIMVRLGDNELGIFGEKTRAAVLRFQETARDPDGGARLEQDGTVGRSDARALFTPLINQVEAEHRIPDRLLRGEIYHESALDPGAVGFYIYYPDYRGVDRGLGQINSKANPGVDWRQAFDPAFSIPWSGKRMRSFFDQFSRDYPNRSEQLLWDAAVCAHNSPVAARAWVRGNGAQTDQAAAYVNAVKAARY